MQNVFLKFYDCAISYIQIVEKEEKSSFYKKL